MIIDICKEHGFCNLRFMPELEEIIKKSNIFASFLTKVNPELENLLLRNETFNASPCFIIVIARRDGNDAPVHDLCRLCILNRRLSLP